MGMFESLIKQAKGVNLSKEEKNKFEEEKTAINNNHLRQVAEAEAYRINKHRSEASSANQSYGQSSANTVYGVKPYSGNMMASPYTGPAYNQGSGQMSAPVDYPISNSFRSGHDGVDYAIPKGVPVKAAADGKVINIMNLVWNGQPDGRKYHAEGYTSYGKAVVIDHGGGLVSYYAHLDSWSVSLGQVVSKGTVVGASGNTGNSTGPHLHFEVRLNGTPVNPTKYLGG